MAHAIFEPNFFPYNTTTFSNLIHSSHTYLPMKMEQTECQKCRDKKFRRRGITQKKAHKLTKCWHFSLYVSSNQEGEFQVSKPEGKKPLRWS